ncbi:MAG: Sec-independent protein translocase protein TatB [Parvibaculales bacterium]
MFDLGWAEMLLLGIVVLLVMGPRELPNMLRTLGRLARRMRVLSQGFRSQIDEIAREVDPRADLQRITYSHPYEEDAGTPTLFDEPPEDAASSSDDASEKPVPKKKTASKKKTVSKKKPVAKKKSGVKKKVVSKKGDDDERQ